jgi:hypothetical protein
MAPPGCNPQSSYIDPVAVTVTSTYKRLNITGHF